MNDAAVLLRFLLAPCAQGVALLAITKVVGTSSRAIGGLMAVRGDGVAFGSLSGGCVEAAIIGEARRVIEAGQPESIRFGQDSRMVDIRLPCGGGLDVLIVPLPPGGEALRQACAWLEARRPATLAIGTDGQMAAWPQREEDETGWREQRFLVRLAPRLRLVVAGHGAETLALARQAGAFGAALTVLSPDEAILAAAAGLGAQTLPMRRRGHVPEMKADPHTAVVTLFHDHEWETALLAGAVRQEAFFIGAMGSRATHAARLRALAGLGVEEAALARIIGPIGLIHATRDPETLALSALAQIASAYQAALARRPAGALAALPAA